MNKRTLQIIFIFTIMLTSLYTLYLKIEVKRSDEALKQYNKTNDEVNQFLSSYYLMRGSVIYYGSQNSPLSLKEKSLRIIQTELANQTNSIEKMDYYFNRELQSEYLKMKNDYSNIITDIKIAIKSDNQKLNTELIFYQMPVKRNFFRSSAEVLLKNLSIKKHEAISINNELITKERYLLILTNFLISIYFIFFIYVQYFIDDRR